MVKSRSFSPASELDDFTSETRDVVLNYFSLLPVQAQDGILGGSLNSNLTNSSTTRTFKADSLITDRRNKEAWSLVSQKDATQKQEKIGRTEAASQSKLTKDSDSDEVDEVDCIDSGCRRQKIKQEPKHRFGRSVSYDEHNLRKRSQDGKLCENKGRKIIGSIQLLSEPKPVINRARSVSPARPTTLNIIPVYPSPGSNLQIIKQGGRQQIKSDRKLNKLDFLEKRDIPKDEVARKPNFDSVHAGLKRQLSNKAQSEWKAVRARSSKSSLQNSHSSSIDRTSLKSDTSTSKTQSSGISESVLSVLDWDDDEVKKLVDDNIVSSVAVSLKHAIEETIAEDPSTEESISRSPAKSRPSDFNKRLSGSLNSKITRSPTGRCVTPQTEVARLIAAIGDQIQQEYGHILNQAINNAVDIPEERIDPETLGEIISREGLMNREQGWKKTVMVLAFCKGLALAMVSKNRSITRLLDSTVEMLADSFAEFVIRQGGWTGILSADVAPASLLTPVSSPIDEVENFPLDWDDMVEHGSSHQVDGSFGQNDEQYGAVGGLGVSDKKTPVSIKGSPSSDTRRKDSDSMDEKDLERVRMEIWLMRQISEQYDQENQHRRQWSIFSTAALTVVSLTVLGGALVLFLKRRDRIGALFSFLRK